MKTLSRTAGAVLDAVTAGLDVGAARTVDNSNGVYMALHVDRLTDATFSLAHYYGQNGDLLCDPDGVFLKTSAGWHPITLQLCTGHFTVAVELDGNDRPTGWRPRQYRELSSFAAMWLRNVCEQQGGIAKIQASL